MILTARRSLIVLALAPVLILLPQLTAKAHAISVVAGSTGLKCDNATSTDSLGSPVTIGTTCGGATIVWAMSGSSRVVWARATASNASSTSVKLTNLQTGATRVAFGQAVNGRSNFSYSTQTMPLTPGLYSVQTSATGIFKSRISGSPIDLTYYAKVNPTVTIRIA